MVVAEELRVLFTGDNSSLKRALDIAKGDLTSFSSDAKGALKNLGELAIVAGIAKFGESAIKASEDFQTAFVPVRQSVQGTKAEMDTLDGQLQKLSTTSPTTAAGLDTIAAAVGQLGVHAPDVAAVTKAINEFALATSTPVDEATASLTAYIKASGAAPTSAANIASAVVGLKDTVGASASGILEFASAITQTAQAAGFTQPQVLALAATMSHVGVESTRGGMAFNKVFTDMAAAIRDGGKNLDAFARISGMTTTQFTKAFKTDAAGALQAFLSGLKKTKDANGDVLGDLKELNLDAGLLAPSLLKAADASGTLTTAFQESGRAYEDQSAIQKDAADATDTAAAHQAELRNELDLSMKKFGDALVPIKEMVISGLVPLVQFLGNVADTFNSFPWWVKDSIVGIAVAIGAVVVATKAYNLYTEIAAAWAAVFGADEVTETAETAAATAAIEAKTVALGEMAVAEEAAGAASLEGGAAGAAGAGEGLAGAAGIGGAGAAGAGGLGAGAIAGGVAIGAGVGLAVTKGLYETGVMDKLGEFSQSIGAKLGEAAKPTQAAASVVLAPLVALGAGVDAIVKGKGWNGFVDNLKSAFGPAGDYLHSFATSAVGWGKSIVDGIGNGIHGAWDGLKNSLGDAGNGIKNWFTNTFGIHSPSTWFRQQGEFMVAGLAKGIEGLEGVFQQPIGKAVDDLKANLTVPAPVGVAAGGAAAGPQRVTNIHIDRIEVPVQNVGSDFDPAKMADGLRRHLMDILRSVGTA